MEFSDPPRRAAEASLLPMINVVFLLLIFFLIAARMTPQEPFAVSPPEAAAAQDADEALGQFTLYLDVEGRAGYRGALGEAALPALAAARAQHCAVVDCAVTPPRLSLRADARSPAAVLAGLMPRLGALGFADLELVVLAAAGAR